MKRLFKRLGTVVTNWYLKVPQGTSDAAPLDRMQLGAHAQRLVDDPVLALAFERVERDLTTTWKSSALGGTEEREAAYRQIWALAQVRAKLIAIAGDAKMLKAEQERKEAADRAVAARRERQGFA